jgi:hypothetical protein
LELLYAGIGDVVMWPVVSPKSQVHLNRLTVHVNSLCLEQD